MYRWLWGLPVLWMSCTPAPAPTGPEMSPAMKQVSVSPCEEARQRLSPFVPPIQIPTGQSSDPFSPEVQEWLKKYLPSAGVFAPLGRWTNTPSKELWLIEYISADGTFFYAVLVDSACAVLDTARWAYQQIFSDKMSQAQASLERDGTCIIRAESRVTEFVGEEPRTTTTTSEKRYQVDWAAGKLRSL